MIVPGWIQQTRGGSGRVLTGSRGEWEQTRSGAINWRVLSDATICILSRRGRGENEEDEDADEVVEEKSERTEPQARASSEGRHGYK